MKNITTFTLCIICAISLLSCFGSSNRNFVAINKTSSNIGFVVSYGKLRTTIRPYDRFQHYERINGIHPDFTNYTLSNLDDTTSINVSEETILRVWEGTSLETKTDTILYNSYSWYGRYTYQWVITDELLSIMEYDETLLAEFPEFYAK